MDPKANYKKIADAYKRIDNYLWIAKHGEGMHYTHLANTLHAIDLMEMLRDDYGIIHHKSENLFANKAHLVEVHRILKEKHDAEVNAAFDELFA